MLGNTPRFDFYTVRQINERRKAAADAGKKFNTAADYFAEATHIGMDSFVTLRNAAAAGDASISAARLIRDLEEMVNVDTNDLMQLRVVRCQNSRYEAAARGLR